MMLAFFILFSVILLAAAILMVASRNPIYSALFLVVAFFAMAGLYFLLGAPFLSIVQIIVYAGAIMVLFLFVIMLLNLRDEERTPIGQPRQVAFGILLAIILLVQLLLLAALGSRRVVSGISGSPLGTVEALGGSLFSQYLYPFEVASVLLLVGIVGAIIMGRKKLPKEE